MILSVSSYQEAKQLKGNLPRISHESCNTWKLVLSPVEPVPDKPSVWTSVGRVHALKVTTVSLYPEGHLVPEDPQMLEPPGLCPG